MTSRGIFIPYLHFISVTKCDVICSLLVREKSARERPNFFRAIAYTIHALCFIRDSKKSILVLSLIFFGIWTSTVPYLSLNCSPIIYSPIPYKHQKIFLHISVACQAGSQFEVMK